MSPQSTLRIPLTSFGHFALELCSNFLPVIYPLLIAAMGLTYAQVGFVALVLGVGASLTQPVFGYLSDRWGPWKMAALGVAWTGAVMGLAGFAPNYAVLVLVVGVGALGSAAFHPAGATIASSRGGKRRGAAVSVFSVGGNLGAALSPVLVAAVVGLAGLRGTAVLVPVALLCGLGLYGTLGRAANPSPRASTDAAPTHADLARNGWLLGLALTVLATMCRSWFQVTLMTYLPTWFRGQGHTLAFGGQMLFVFSSAMGAGSLTGGALSDRIGRWQVLALSFGLLGPAYWLFLNASTLTPQVVLLAVMGVLIGCTFPVGIVLAQDVWPRGIGLASALVMGLGWAPGGIGASFTGLLADSHSLSVGLQWLVIAPVLSLGALLAFAGLHRRQRVIAIGV